MMRLKIVVACGLLALLIGCNRSTAPAAAPVPSAEAEKYLLDQEPAAATSVAAAKESAEDGQEITLVGRIGGSTSPFIAGRAAFTLVDKSLVPCSEKENDSCPTPWDYCCDTDRLKSHTAMVKVVDESGQAVPLDARQDLGMQELQTVVVRGTAKRDEAGNLTILAPAVFVKK